MKKLIIVGFSAALLAGGVSSCKKTSKGKMANEWTVSKMNSESTSKDSDGDTYSDITSIDGATGTSTSTSTYTSGGVTTTNTTKKTAAVSEFSYTIEKDGTFKSVMNVTWTETGDGWSESSTTNNSTSGTWSFLSKNKTGEFKANERVIFNTLSETSSNTSSYTSNGVTAAGNPSSSTDTYAEGENTMVYVVVESKGKELQLKADEKGTSSNSYTSGSTTTTSTSSDTGMRSMTLVQK